MTAFTVAELNVYPIKSCSGIAQHEATLFETGFEYDRTFMVVDAGSGKFITQRTHPQLALVKTEFKLGQLSVRAAGMMRMDLPLDTAGDDIQVTVWQDTFLACDMGNVAAQWFSNVLGQSARLVRFDPEIQRAVSEKYNPGIAATTEFADGYPLLVISRASLADVNGRLAAKGIGAIAMNRFRPNIVIDGVAAFEEDYIDTLTIGDTVIKLVKPCVRCEIPNTDQDTGERYAEPGRTLATYRARADMMGGICVGMNAIVLRGAGAQFSIGQRGLAQLNL